MAGVMIAAEIQGFLVQRSGDDRVDFILHGQRYSLRHVFVGSLARPGVNRGKRQIRRQIVHIQHVNHAKSVPRFADRRNFTDFCRTADNS